MNVSSAIAQDDTVTDVERQEVLTRYEAAIAAGDQTTAVRYVLDYTVKAYGENSPATVKLTHRYGHLLYQDGQYRESTDVLKTALNRSIAAFGESGGDAYEINMNIGYSYSQWSPILSTRMKYFDRALEILRERGERETIAYVTTLVNIVVNLMDNDGLSGSYAIDVGDDFGRYMDEEIVAWSPEQEYTNHFNKAEKYVREAAELAGILEEEDEYLSAKIAIAQAKLNILDTADRKKVPSGVRGRVTTRSAKRRNDREADRLTTAIDTLSADIEGNMVFLTAANKSLMDIAWMDKDRGRMDAMCANGTLNSASEYPSDRLYRVEDDGSVIAPNFSFNVPTNIFKPVVKKGEQPTDEDGNPIRRPHFVPVCINGELMAALVNAPRVVIEEYE